MNRGSLPPASHLVTVSRASMRPRFMNRGSERVAAPLALPFVGFNEAPIHESGKSAARLASGSTSLALQ